MTKHLPYFQHALRVFRVFLPLGVLALSGGCSAPTPKPSPPAPSVSFSKVSRAISGAKDDTAKALTVVDRVREYVSDPNARAELASASAALVRVTVQLREAEEGRLVAEKQAQDLRQWGEAKESEAIENGEGWREAKADADKQRGFAWKWRLASFGLAGAIVAYFAAPIILRALRPI